MLVNEPTADNAVLLSEARVGETLAVESSVDNVALLAFCRLEDVLWDEVTIDTETSSGRVVVGLIISMTGSATASIAVCLRKRLWISSGAATDDRNTSEPLETNHRKYKKLSCESTSSAVMSDWLAR